MQNLQLMDLQHLDLQHLVCATMELDYLDLKAGRYYLPDLQEGATMELDYLDL